jgi:hypothetical protein
LNQVRGEEAVTAASGVLLDARNTTQDVLHVKPGRPSQRDGLSKDTLPKQVIEASLRHNLHTAT